MQSSLFVLRAFFASVLILSVSLAGCSGDKETSDESVKAPPAEDVTDREGTGEEPGAQSVPAPRASDDLGGQLDTAPGNDSLLAPPQDEDTAPRQPAADTARPEAPRNSAVIEEQPAPEEVSEAVREARETEVPRLPRPEVPPMFKSLGKALVGGIEEAGSESDEEAGSEPDEEADKEADEEADTEADKEADEEPRQP